MTGEGRAVPCIRAAAPGERAGMLALTPRAFPEEDLTGLVRALIAEPGVLSLVACAQREVAGFVLLTPCRVAGGAGRLALLGPLAVAPERQFRGIGGALVREAVRRLSTEGPAHLLVLGDPGYYARFGFAPETRVLAPHPLAPGWSAAWQSLAVAGAGPAPAGRLCVPAPWRDPALWQP